MASGFGQQLLPGVAAQETDHRLALDIGPIALLERDLGRDAPIHDARAGLADHDDAGLRRRRGEKGIDMRRGEFPAGSRTHSERIRPPGQDP